MEYIISYDLSLYWNFLLFVPSLYKYNHQRILELLVADLQLQVALSSFLLDTKRLGRRRSNAAGPSRPHLLVRTRGPQPARLVHRHSKRLKLKETRSDFEATSLVKKFITKLKIGKKNMPYASKKTYKTRQKKPSYKTGMRMCGCYFLLLWTK